MRVVKRRYITLLMEPILSKETRAKLVGANIAISCQITDPKELKKDCTKIHKSTASWEVRRIINADEGPKNKLNDNQEDHVRLCRNCKCTL